MDGFDFLRDAFKNFANNFDAQDIAARAARSIGAGGKALVDRGLEEFPADFIKGIVEDAYALVTSQDVAEGISMNVRSLDEEKIQQVLDLALAKVQEGDNALKLAKVVKQVLAQTTNNDIEGAIEQLIPQDRFAERMIVKAFLMQASPVLDELRGMEEAELAEKLVELAGTIPTDFIAQQVGALTREITPERIAAQTHAAVGRLPSGKAIGDIVHNVGKSASKHFEAASKARSAQDAAKALGNFADEAQTIVSSTIANDQAAKKKFDKKGGGDYTL
jgi:hypothetical protein